LHKQTNRHYENNGHLSVNQLRHIVHVVYSGELTNKLASGFLYFIHRHFPGEPGLASSP